MVEYDDEAMQRLRAADPALGSNPDLQGIRRRVAQKAPASQGADSVTMLRDDPFGKGRSTIPWLVAAAVAALATGAGGYALGARQPDPENQRLVSSQEPDREVGSPAGGGIKDELPELGQAAAEAAESVGGEADGGASRDSEAGYGLGVGEAYDQGPVRLTASPDLSAEASTGEVRMLAADADPEQVVQDWVAALGLDTVDVEDTGWFGSGNVALDPETLESVHAGNEGGGLYFSYDNMLATPYCEDMYAEILKTERETLEEEWRSAVGPDIPFPEADQCRPPSGELPSNEEAVTIAEDFLAETGLDFSEFDLQVPEWGTEDESQVLVEGTVKGDTEMANLYLSVSVGPEGVINANGQVGTMESLGEYPVISPAEAVTRYQDPVFQNGAYSVFAEDQYDGDGTEEPASTARPGLMAAERLTPGAKIPLLIKDKVVVDAELIQTQLWVSDTALDVPAWRLITEDGMSYSVLALADEAIDWQSWD